MANGGIGDRSGEERCARHVNFTNAWRRLAEWLARDEGPSQVVSRQNRIARKEAESAIIRASSPSWDLGLGPGPKLRY